MPRKPRIEYPGAVYHVMNRGDRGRRTFRDKLDYQGFLAGMQETCLRTGWRIHAYVLMPNHFHWLLETPEANLVEGMKWFLGAYSQRFNVRHGQRGHVFQGRYKAIVIQADSGGYFETVSTYIHLNPARAKLLPGSGENLQAYGWSSLPHYLTSASKRPAWLATDRVLGNLDLRDHSRGRKEYPAFLAERMGELWTKTGRKEYRELWRPIRHGWYVGDDTFKTKLLRHLGNSVSGKQRNSYSGEAIQAHDQVQAEQLVQRGMRELGLTEAILRKLPKSDERKCALAWLVHTRTVARHAWMAQRLGMGVPSNLSTYIRSVREGKTKTLLALRRPFERRIRK